MAPTSEGNQPPMRYGIAVADSIQLRPDALLLPSRAPDPTLWGDSRLATTVFRRATVDIPDLKVPDLWYDAYARLMPGALFVGLTRALVLQKPDVPSATEVAILAGLGYVVAFMSQPFASILARVTKNWAENKGSQKYGAGYVREVQARIGPKSQEAAILNKMQGEIMAFCQFVVLGIVFMTLQWKYVPHDQQWLGWTVVFSLVCCVGAFFTSIRRLQRAIDVDPESAARALNPVGPKSEAKLAS
jgi:hypothetical protein